MYASFPNTEQMYRMPLIQQYMVTLYGTFNLTAVLQERRYITDTHRVSDCFGRVSKKTVSVSPAPLQHLKQSWFWHFRHIKDDNIQAVVTFHCQTSQFERRLQICRHVLPKKKREPTPMHHKTLKALVFGASG